MLHCKKFSSEIHVLNQSCINYEKQRLRGLWRGDWPTKTLDERAQKNDSSYARFGSKRNIYSPGFVRTREIRLRGTSLSKL